MSPPISARTAPALHRLSRAFAGGEAVNGLDLAIAPGEIYGFLGPNGAGKSTTVRMLCTLLAPTSGTARVAGHDIVDDAQQVRLRIGAALQDISLDPRQTGRELLRLQCRFYGLPKNIIDNRLEELTDLVDIGDALDRRIETYSPPWSTNPRFSSSMNRPLGSTRQVGPGYGRRSACSTSRWA